MFLTTYRRITTSLGSYRLLAWRNWPSSSKTMILAASIGIATGLLSALLAWSVEALTHVLFYAFRDGERAG